MHNKTAKQPCADGMTSTVIRQPKGLFIIIIILLIWTVGISVGWWAWSASGQWGRITKSKTMEERDEIALHLERMKATQAHQSSIPGYFQDDYVYCEKNNIVLDRKDFLSTGHKEARPYSVTNYTFASDFHGKKCSSLEETLLAIKHGTRRWVDKSQEDLGPLEREEFQSYFVPNGCDLPYLPAQTMCHEFNKYSHIFAIGDSLTRHFQQALLIGLKKDLVLGGIESTDKYGSYSPYRQCRCDNQFSEHQECRQNNGFFSSLYPRDLGVCSQLPDSKPHFHLSFSEMQKINFLNEREWSEVNCEDPKSRGVLLLLQGGAHFGNNAKHTAEKILNPIVANPVFQSCLSLNKVNVVWITYGSQSRQLDAKYPRQSRENALKFNSEMEGMLRDKMPYATIIDWWELSKDAQTSDGFHFLTDVNLVKVNHFLHVIQYLE